MTVDLRSDTVTRPDPAMYRAMQEAPLGDDVLGDEPTVQKLEQVAAERTGMEAAMFVPSGTMGNLCAVCSWTRPGDAVVIEEEAHILFYECGGAAVIAGAMFRSVPSNGVMTVEDIEARITPGSIHTPATTLLCLENTHNRKGGAVIPVEMHREYRALANAHGLHIHLDGARVFNAAVALGVDIREITSQVDSVNFCFSKGLGAPVGSALCGPREFIDRAKHWRKRVGGGMRQSGVLAACALVAMEGIEEKLSADHARAERIRAALSTLPGVNPYPVATNIVMVNTEVAAQDWQDQLAANGVLCFAVAANRLRLVLHRDVSDEGVEQTINVFRKLAIQFA
jgi:threonine aldolase